MLNSSATYLPTPATNEYTENKPEYGIYHGETALLGEVFPDGELYLVITMDSLTENRNLMKRRGCWLKK